MSSWPPEETTRWYEDKVRRYGYDHRGLGFRNKSSQDKRFEALVQLGDLDGARLLDVGCGFGDLLAWLRARGIEPDYTGIDLCEPMIQRCRERFGDTGARSELLLNLCKEVGPRATFFGGLGGSRRYLDQEAFAREGIGVRWQELKHPVYPQCGEGPFQPGLTSLDILFNVGPLARELVWKTIEARDDERVAA